MGFMQQPYSIAILGAGLQGCCIAMELARNGHKVALLERDAVAMNRASLRNEGKIHLGLIYANDRTLATGALQLDGALHFRALLARWIGEDANDLGISTPFHYLVPNDSVLAPHELERHYDAIESLCRERLLQNPELDYLGTKPNTIATPISKGRIARHFSPDYFQAAFETAELAIDTHLLAIHLREAITTHPNITFLPSHTIRAIERRGDLFRIEGDDSENAFAITAHQVVNATWENRMALDESVGIKNHSGWLHRMKYRIIARLPERLRGAPSATLVLGRYGDVVVRPDGTAYLSWYPAGLKGWSHDLRPPKDWNAPCSGNPDDKVAQELISQFLPAIDAWYPGIAESEPLIVDAGVIVAHGRTDVDDPLSGLHGRARVGVTSTEGYHSVDPGKLTTAPLFAMEAAVSVMSWNALSIK